MAKNHKFVLEGRDASSIVESKKKKKTHRKRSLKDDKTKSSSKTNIGTNYDPIYINEQDDDSDTVVTIENKLPNIINTGKNIGKQNGQKKNGEPSQLKPKVTITPTRIKKKLKESPNKTKHVQE